MFNRDGVKAPCYGCMRRTLTCHSFCEEYKLFREALDAKLIENAKKHEGDSNSIIMKLLRQKRLGHKGKQI